MRGAILIVVLAATSGCSGYRPGSFAAPGTAFAGERRTIGCLDVAVAPVHDALAEGIVAGFTFANRCDRAATVDVGAVTAVGRGAGGVRVLLAAYDPRGEIRPAELEARSVAAETIEYAIALGAPAIAELCLDLSRIDRDAETGGEPVVVCIAGGAPVAAAEVAR